MSQPIFVAVAWPYANGDLHIGHLAGALLPADIFARYHRLKGNDVLLVSGTDAHGTPITIAADEQGVTPQAIFEKYHERFLETLSQIGLSFDLFTHTDTENHMAVSQGVFCSLYEQGLIEPQEQKLLFTSDNRVLPDRYVAGTCPVCHDPSARGDQCEACGSLLDAIDLINPRSTIDGSRPEVRTAPHLFLNLPAFSEQLQTYYAQNAHYWRPHVLNFSRRFVEDGLKPRAISRDLDWGIDIPLPDWEGKKLYIWFENIIGYLSASQEWARLSGDSEKWKKWWCDPAGRSYYFLGKDNIPFHTIFWPVELLGLNQALNGEKLNLPYDVPANHNLTIEHRPLSKSQNWAVWLPDILTRYQPDAIRYAIAANLPENRDTDFTWPAFVNRVNGELIGTWGNLVNRVLSFAHKHWGCVPKPGEIDPAGQALLTSIQTSLTTIGSLIEAVQLRPALQEALAQARAVNAYLDRAEWFRVIKTDKQAAATTIYTALQAINALKILLAPFVPHTAERLHHSLGYKSQLFGKQKRQSVQEKLKNHEVLVYDDSGVAGNWAFEWLPAGQILPKPTPLYRKIDTAIIEEEQSRLGR